jgi:hypothetical protein
MPLNKKGKKAHYRFNSGTNTPAINGDQQSICVHMHIYDFQSSSQRILLPRVSSAAISKRNYDRTVRVPRFILRAHADALTKDPNSLDPVDFSRRK